MTVINYDPLALGRAAATLAIERMQDPAGFTRQLEMPTWLVPRGTGERPPAERTTA